MANGPRMPVDPPRGPERIDESSARWSGVSVSSDRMGRRGGGIFFAGDLFADMLFADFFLADIFLADIFVADIFLADMGSSRSGQLRWCGIVFLMPAGAKGGTIASHGCW
jgi:hypothetical protein